MPRVGRASDFRRGWYYQQLGKRLEQWTMGKTWILVAHRSGARLFENRGPGKGLDLLQSLDNPAGKLKNQKIDSDKPGRYADGRQSNRHGYGHDQEPTMHIAEQFAKQLVSLLEDGRNRQRYTKLVVVADPRFLGILRAALPSQTSALLAGTLDKDLGSINARELPRHLEPVLNV